MTLDLAISPVDHTIYRPIRQFERLSQFFAGVPDALCRNKYSAVFDFPVMRDPDEDEDDSGDDNSVYTARPQPKQKNRKEAAFVAAA